MTAHLIHAWVRRLRGAARLGGLRNGARGKRFAVFHPTSGACRPGDRAALVGGVGWMTAQPHPCVGSAATRVRQARWLTQRGAWKTLRGFPPYIRRPPPGRSGAPVGHLAVGWMTAQPHPRVGSAAARVRQARCLTQRGAWKTRCGFPTYIRRPPPGRSGGACGGGRRVDDGAASSTRGFGGCEGPPGSVPYATGRVETLRGFPPYIRRLPPGRSGGACGGP
jgi:hypothetical protein